MRKVHEYDNELKLLGQYGIQTQETSQQCDARAIYC